jgi:hypothetical protein
MRDTQRPGAEPSARIVAAILQAGRQLEAAGFTSGECEEMLRPLLKVAANTDWKGRRGSVVVFRSPDFTMVKFWPETLAPRVHFGQEFLILPLLRGMQRKQDFWLLALSVSAVRLFRGSASGFAEIPLRKGVPRSLSEYGAFDQPDHTLRGRSSAGPSSGGMKGVPFGTSSARELQTEYLQDFFKAVDRGIHVMLSADRYPLILAGVTRELALYRKVNTYSPVLAGAVHGSLESLGVDVLHTRAAALMEAFSARAMAATLAELEEAASRGLLVTDPAAVIEAARAGQVEELIVPAPEALVDQREETVNWAALATIRNSGRIAFRSSPELDTGVAAILRYQASDLTQQPSAP